MIKQGEAKKTDGSALTAGEYAVAVSDKSGLAYEVVVQQYGPDWYHSEEETNISYLRAVNLDSTYLARAYQSGTTLHVEMRHEDDTSWTDLSIDSAPTISNHLFSLAADSGTLYLFYYDGSDVQVMSCDTTAETPEFGGSSSVYTLANVEALAAVSPDKIYLSYLSSLSNHVLASLIYTDEWSLAESGVYWPFPFDSFDAVALDDWDVVAFSGDLPPLWGTRAVGTEVSSYFQRVQGIVYFTVRNGRWSDYRTHDVVDRDVYGYSRTGLRLSRVNDYAMMSYNRHMIFRKYDADGALLTPGSSDRLCPAVSRSLDGSSWEFPEMVMRPTTPFVVLATTNRLFAVSSDGMYDSNPCLWAGQVPRSQTLTRSTLDVRSQAGDVRQTGIELANPYDSDGRLPTQVLDNTLVDWKLRLLLKVYLGYWGEVDGTRTALPLLVSTEDVIKRVRSHQGYRHVMALQSTDVLGRAVRTRSDYSAEWNCQIVSRDAFTDETGTGYGGMKHMAPLEGQWKASDGVLNLVSSLHRSLAESILITDTLNGSGQVGFMLNDPSLKEYGGISFRVLDKDNYFYVFYDIESDTIQLCQNKSGPDTEFARSAAMGWNTGGVWHYLRVDLRYAIVHVYTSSDGVTWTELSWASGSNEIPGMLSISNGVTYTNWSGKIGVVGKGYSDADEPPPVDPIVLPLPTPTPIPVSSDAKIAWMVHYNAGSNPSTCVIYEILDDLDNPVYKKLVPPAELNIDSLHYGNYSSVYDKLILVGYATSTPVIPGWGGYASDVILIVSGATTDNPSWEMVAYGFTGIPGTYEARVAVGDGWLHSDTALMTKGINELIHPTLIGVLPYLNPLTGAYASNGELYYVANGADFYFQGYKRSQDDFIMYDGPTATISDGVTGNAALANPNLYDYTPGFVRGDSSPARIHFIRRRKSDGLTEIVYVDTMGGYGGGITITPTAQFTLDETPVAAFDTCWRNTIDMSGCFNVVPNIAYLGGFPLYYCIGGSWAKASAPTAWGWANYFQRTGGNALMWMARGAVANGNEPARYTRDVTDMDNNPWIGMTGNMWSGDNKIIASGGLNIIDAWLSF